MIASYLLVSVLAAVAIDPAERFEETQTHMGVPFKIVLYAPDNATASKALLAAFERIHQLDGIMSDYDPESELSRLSQLSPTPKPVKVSGDLWRVLMEAQELSANSDGAFDVTVGPLSRLWRRARRQKALPAGDQLDEALAAVGYKHLHLDCERQTVSLTRPNMRLDLGGIAKGYAADEALAVLRAHGVDRALVDASGDIAMGDPPPNRTGWRIGIAPLEANGSPSRFLQLANCAVATSGDAWQYVEIDGRRYSHIIDPRTGLGLTDHSSVTVVANTCTRADGLASTVSVLGPRSGVRLVDGIDDAAVLVVRALNDNVETIESKRFRTLDMDP